ncbi:MAG: hypothetical protein H6Q03_2118 [Acidobacteria bacterium]|jgi:hypothetical protein|nr:hypothetical protein [Acidobacteriota bacterium]
MRFSERERRLLGALALLAALSGLWTLWRVARPAAGAAGVSTGAPARPARAARARTGALPERIVELRVDRLDPHPRDLAVGRDPFRFAPIAPPPPPPPSPEELARRLEQEEERRRLAEERAAQALLPRPPDVDLRFLGSFGPRSRRIAVFADASGANVFNAREGDTLEGKFTVEKIGFESVDLAFVGFPDVPARRLGLAP